MLQRSNMLDRVKRGVLAPLFVLGGMAFWTAWEEHGG